MRLAYKGFNKDLTCTMGKQVSVGAPARSRWYSMGSSTSRGSGTKKKKHTVPGQDFMRQIIRLMYWATTEKDATSS
jgi:hypothetical protein